MAAPAEPILASSIWLSTGGRFTNSTSESSAKESRLSTSEKGIDTALGGGLEYGFTYCITSDLDQDTTKLVQALLISHLTSSRKVKASVIDSTLSFDVRQLYQVLETSLGGAGGAKKDIMKILQHLNIMRVFDYAGLTEAVAELQEILEHPPAAATTVESFRKAPRSTVDDSEDEGEMLESLPSDHESSSKGLTAVASDARPTGLLIINNMTQVMAPLHKNNYSQGQAVLSSFMRSLGHITRAHNLCTVLIANSGNKSAAQDETLSLFKFCTIRPALGRGFGYLVDVHMYLHSFPATRIAQSEGEGKGVKMANVLEVVEDRHGGRVGHWAAFVCDEDGRLRGASRLTVSTVSRK